MKLKTSTVPTRTYAYGCLPPIEGKDEIEDQLRRAHRYRNKLVEIERRRRERIADAQRQHDVLGPILAAQEVTDTTIAETRRLMKLARAGKGDAEEVAALRELVETAHADAAMLRFFVARARALAKEEGAFEAAYAEIEQQANAETKAIRAADDAPYWGTYLVLEKSVQQWRAAVEPPRFVRYDGSGRVVVQLQQGRTTAAIGDGRDTQLRICDGQPLPRKHCDGLQAKIPAKARTVWLRVRSDEKKRPVWTKLPFILHRPLPDDGRIMWAWIQRRRVGSVYKYEFMLSVEAPSFEDSATPAQPRRAQVAIDIGTRALPTSEVRAAVWLDSDGNTGEVKSGLTRLSSPKSSGEGRRRPVPNDGQKLADLQAIRSKSLDAIKLTVAGYLTTVPGLDWLAQATSHLSQWRSPARIAILRRTWVRHDGDEAVYEAIERYLRQDRHLWDWEANQRSRHINRRSSQYSNFAVQMARCYDTIVIAKRDYRRAEEAPEHAASTRGTEGRALMRSVAPGELAEEIKRAAKKYGAKVIEVRLKGDTMWALDQRVCMQLHASAEAIKTSGAPIARGKARNHVASIEPRNRRRLGTAERKDPLANRDVSIG